MDIIHFIAEYWHDILVVVALVLGLIFSLVKFIPKWKGMSYQEKVAYITRLLENLLPSALSLVTQAEMEYGPGTGKLKRAAVIDELYSRIPDEFKAYVTEANLEEVLNKALEEAKYIWETNSEVKKLIAKT